jgi:hypothetical protein
VDTTTPLVGKPIRVADSLVTVDARPAFFALATLPLHFVILLKALFKMIKTGYPDSLISIVFRIKELIDILRKVTISRIKSIDKGILATRPLSTLLLRNAAPGEMNQTVVDVMNHCEEWVLPTV